MARDFEYISYNDADRIAILENRAAELERRLLAALPPDAPLERGRQERGRHEWTNVATPGAATPTAEADPPRQATAVRYAYEIPAFGGDDTGSLNTGSLNTGPSNTGPSNTGPVPAASLGTESDGDLDGGPAGGGPAGPDGRTEELINHGRSRARPARSRRILAHWRMLAVGAVALLAGIIAAVVAFGGGGGAWPGSVATVQTEIKTACENPDVAAEPSGFNFACAKDTQPVLWVFSLLTSGDNPGFVDQSTGRKGLEPIQPSQGGDIAWSLNLHHPYDPGNPIDSLQVAARAINNIISGATLTSTSGGALVEPGLESKPANCQRYTGSAKLATQSGYPARCAAPFTTAGEAALVSDVFQQWMGGTPSQIAQQAGVLFENAGNPGDPQVQAILNSLPASGG